MVEPRRGASGDAPSDPSTAAFRLENVSAARNGRTLLHGITACIPRGKVTVLFGPSGAGKSTLLRLLNRLDEAAGGQILYRDEPIVSVPVRELRCRIGFVFQTPVLFPGTVRSNLEAAGGLAGLAAAEVAGRVPAVMELAGLDPSLLDREGAGLSVGEKQRVTLARALMSRPESLLLDEPTSALDPASADHLLETLRRLRDQEGLTVVLTTHRLAEIRGTADRGIMLEAGRLVEEGAADRIFFDPQEEATRVFLGHGNGMGQGPMPASPATEDRA